MGNSEKKIKDKNYKMPVYLQLRELIRHKVEEGEYSPGTAIPSENKLAETFGINRLTVRNAVDALVNEGILQREHGKGVFVVGEKYEELLEEQGGFIGSETMSKRVTVKEQIKTLRYAGDKYANFFNIDPKDLIFYIRHLKCVDELPLSLEEIYIPQAVIPQLEEVNSSVFNMRDIFKFYGIEQCSMRQSMELFTGEDSKTRKMLKVSDDVALFMLECNYRDQNGSMIEVTRSYIRSDKESFRINMHN
ncbi:MAG: GntR family transcriptional regulator [Suipraeoptans sp.]